MSTAPSQKDRYLQIHPAKPLSEDDLLITSLRGYEEISRLFQFEFDLISADLGILAEKIVGKSIAVTMRIDSENDRFFHGYVRRFSAGITTDAYRLYRAEVVPWLWFLTRSASCRIFQKKTALEIIQQIFDDHGFADYKTDDVKTELAKTVQWDYCVQYRETAFNFVSRLMEQVGIYYYFQHEKTKHTLVLSDQKFPGGKGATVPFKHKDTREHSDQGIVAWEHQYEFRTGKWAHTDFDYLNTATDLVASMETGRSDALGTLSKKYEVYDYPGDYRWKGDGTFGTKGTGEQFATVRIEAEEVPVDVVSGESDYKKFSPGVKFTTEDPVLPVEDGKTFVITSIEHEANEPAQYESGQAIRRMYSNRFTCVPDSVVFRPARLSRKPTVEGPQTAIVVGKETYDASSKVDQEILTDKYGRVKVQFHWDREGKLNESSSCWVRVSQAQAGAGWGGVHLPRKGEEVIVEFLEGDPDRPIITGRVYNAQNMPPYTLPDNRTKSGFKSRSTLEGKVDENFNELWFEDKKGEELISIHAEKDFQRVVENDDFLIVGSDKCKEDHGSQTIEIWKHRTETVHKGDETVTIEEGNRVVTISKGNDTLEITKGKLDIHTGNDIIALADKNISLTATDSKISLVVGQSKLTMEKDGTIKIEGQKISIDGLKISLSAKAAVSVDAGAALELVGKASATLDSPATTKVAGATLMLQGTGAAQIVSAITTIG